MPRNPYATEWLSNTFPSIANLAPLGSGGQKYVFSGTHADYGAVVLKIFHFDTNPQRALREVEAIKSIANPRIPAIYELGTANSPVGEVIWFLEEYVPGVSLRQVLQSGAIDLVMTLQIGLYVMEAVSAAETARIVHRDIKPENIIVDAEGGRAWLLDFGIARHLDLQSLTATSDPFGVGTPGYVSPEQFRNLKSGIDNRSDLFSLGVTLYECLTGRNPYLDDVRDWREAMRRLEQQDLPALTIPSSDMGDLLVAMTRRRREHRLISAKLALDWMRDICAACGVHIR